MKNNNMIKKEGVSLEKKVELIRKNLSKKDSFTISDIEPILDEKKSTLYWTVWNLSRKGYIHKIGKGLYSLQKKELRLQPIVSPLAKKALHPLRESGYQFFISGLDILSIFMEHVPESYPVMLFVNKESIEDVQRMLSRNNIDSVVSTEVKNYQAIKQLSSVSEVVLIYHTNEFGYSENGIASFEKAFVDLYYEVTRRGYSLSIQELVRIYKNMRRRISLDTQRLIKIASRRHIHYDIRYIVESNLISEEAHVFANMLKKQE